MMSWQPFFKDGAKSHSKLEEDERNSKNLPKSFLISHKLIMIEKLLKVEILFKYLYENMTLNLNNS